MLVGVDGRVRVGDFGLARGAADVDSANPASGPVETTGSTVPTTSSPDDTTTNESAETSTSTPTTEPEETTADPTGDDTTTGGLPEGVLAEGQRYPDDMAIDGGYIYWVNNWIGDCVRRVSLAGGPVEDIYCEPGLMPPADSMGASVGMTIGSACGRTTVGETLYVSSRGLFTDPPALFVVNGNSVTYLRDLDGLTYDLAADDTHLYLTYEQRIERLPLSDLANAQPEVVLADAEEYVGGILVDDEFFYYAESTFVGAIHRIPK